MLNVLGLVRFKPAQTRNQVIHIKFRGTVIPPRFKDLIRTRDQLGLRQPIGLATLRFNVVLIHPEIVGTRLDKISGMEILMFMGAIPAAMSLIRRALTAFVTRL